MPGWSCFQAPQVDVATDTCSSCSPRNGPEVPTPRNVSNIDIVPSSNIILLERRSRPDVRIVRSSLVTHAWAEPHSVQYGMARRRPPMLSFTISWTSIMFFG